METRKWLSALFLLIGMTITTYAQVTVGVKTGATINKSTVSGMVGDILPSTESMLGYHAGIYLEAPLGKSGWAVKPELSITNRGFSMGTGTDFKVLGLDVPVGVKADAQMKYVETAALMKYNIGTGKVSAYVEGGPSLAYATSAYIQPKAQVIIEFNLPRQDIDLSGSMYNRLDIGANVGAGVTYDTGQGLLSAYTRYTHGLSNVFNNTTVNTKLSHRAVSLGVSYGYRF